MDLQKQLERRLQGALQTADDLNRAIANARQKFDVRNRDNRAQIRDLEDKLRAVKTNIAMAGGCAQARERRTLGPHEQQRVPQLRFPAHGDRLLRPGASRLR